MLRRPRSIHFQMTHVHAAETRNATAAASRYIADCRASDPDDLRSIDRAIKYIRDGHHRHDDSRVVATAFVCRGSHSRHAIWHQVDQAFRTKDGSYSRRGGNNSKRGDTFRSGGTPRLAVFADGTLPYDVSEEVKIAIAISFARQLVDTYGCAVEVALHKKGGVIDHAHWLISTRVVDESGVGPVIRAMNGIASKATTKTDDGMRKAGFAEYCRTVYARLLTDAVGELYDARSFQRQGRDEIPMPWLPRPEFEARREARLAASKDSISIRAKSTVSATSVKHSEPSARKALELTAMALSKRVLPLSLLHRPVLALVVSSHISASQRVVVAPTAHIPVGPDLSGKAEDEVAEAIRQAVDRDLRADAEDFRQEQRLLEAHQQARAAPRPSWDFALDFDTGRNAKPSASSGASHPKPDVSATRPDDLTTMPQKATWSLGLMSDQDEEAEEHRRKKQKKRLLQDALDKAAKHKPVSATDSKSSLKDLSLEHTGVRRKLPTPPVSTHDQAQRGTDKSLDVNPEVLRLAAIAAATLTRKMPDAIASIAGMAPDIFRNEVIAAIQVFDKSSDRAAIRKRLIARIQQSKSATLIAMLGNTPSKPTTATLQGQTAEKRLHGTSKKIDPSGLAG